MARASRRRRDPTAVTVERVGWRDTYARVSTAGTTGDRAFILVPGIGVSSNYFERLAFQLNEFGPVHALDLPGFGGVPHPKGAAMTVKTYAELVGRVIDELGLTDPVVVGHSMGTQIVAELAAGRELTDLVLISPVVNPHERRLRTAALRFLQSSRHEPPKVAALAIYAYLLCGVRWFYKVLPSMMRYRIEDTLPKITANTLVIIGERDALCPTAWAQEVADLLPQAQVWRIPGAAHSVMHGNAEVVARLCVHHVRREEPDDDIIRTAPQRTNDEPDPDLPNQLKAARGRATELVGILTDDDQTMAAGKTVHAKAAQEATTTESRPPPD